MSVARQVTRLATGLPPAQPRHSRHSRSRCTCCKTTGRAKICRSDRAAASRFTTTFPVDGEYLIKVRLQRQYQDYLKGMGWPQQLDVRLDGKLLKRFTVGGAGKGRPAAASYAGDGEPGFAGDPEWETYMQLTGDAGLEVRVPVQAGPRVVGVSFVREMWEPEGLPQPRATGPRDRERPGVHGLRERGLGPDRRSLSGCRDRRRIRPAAARFSFASPRRGARGRARLRHDRFFPEWPGSRIAGR